MNAKLDSYMFAGNFNKELEEIVGKIDESGSVPISEDSSDYMMWPHNKGKNKGEGEPPTAPSTGLEPASNLLNEKTTSGFIVKEERQADNTSKVFINGKEITGHSFDTVVDFIVHYIPHKDSRNILQLNSLSILKSDDMDDDLLKRIYDDFKNKP